MNAKPSEKNEEPLKGKVALLFDGVNTGGRSLAESLAQYGADIVFVYRQLNAGRAREMKRLIEAKGRRCLLIPAQNNSDSFSKEVVRQTINQLGRLDILIDYSSLAGDEIDLVNTATIVEKPGSAHKTGPFTNFEIMSAALDQMVDLDQTGS